MKDGFLKNAGREYSPGKRMVLLLCAGLVFLVLLPYGLVILSQRLDQHFGLPALVFGRANLLLGGVCIAGGLFLGLWSNNVLFTSGRGTPIPLMATQELQVKPPYCYCRNPMALGAIVGYLGAALVLGSPAALGLVLAFAGLLLVYIRLLEEKEMELRFGDAYRAYRQQTPFLIPHWRQKR